MSTPITLTVGDIELTYNTHHIGMDHGMLFQEADRQRRRHPYIDYEYCERHQEDVAQSELCFCRSVGSMVSRLELLGYTLSAIKSEYETQSKRNSDQESNLAADGHPDERSHFTFEQLVEFISAHSVRDLTNDVTDHYAAEHPKSQELFASGLTANTLSLGNPERDVCDYSKRSRFDALIEFLDPYSTLRILAENPANLDLDVVWDYGNFVDAGWAKNEDFLAGARRHQTYLIATEGSSDTHILQRGLSLLRPDIEDFFRFIDIEDRHPFSGTGNLAKFAEGLVKIDVHNRVVFLFDNDAEGMDTFRSLQRFNFPVNMRAMVLPDLDELRNFPANGPSGVVSADINGCAAAIECYLDLRLKNRPAAQVRWTNYKESLSVYQGTLTFKDSYAKAFFETSPDAIASGAYDARKLQAVLAALLGQCSQMAAQMLYTPRG